ncbi:MAG: PKD domain-containing protein, partial [Cyclobacteriaceae bacterium]
SQGKITSISFPEGDCDAVSLLSSTSASPVDLFYSSAGDYTVELTAIHPNGNIDRVIERVTVLDQSAPDIRFITSDQCVGSTNTFTSINDSGDITNYRWDFGDGTILEGETNPSYQYASAGSYTASLTVTNGSCESVYSSVVDIYNAPVASFMKPSSNICSNTPLSFTNTSTYDAGSPVSFSWDFDGDNIEDSALENPSFIYAASGTYQVSLKVALLDGCTDIFTDEIILDEGPAVSFDWSNNCFGEAVAFNNTTVDDPTYTYRWDFGDGSEINASRSPIHIYTEAENYTVSLAVNDGSCESLLSRQIEINDQPLASIATSIGVENEPIIFTGNDLTLVGDSIVSWLWDFSGLGTANTQQATYTFNSPPGIYRVTLSVTTAQGCSDEITSDVTVMASTSPSAQIGSSSPVCIGQEVEFANSSLNAESFLWDFCFESLSGLPEIIADFTPVMGISSPEGFELVYDKGNWFGFIGNRSNGQMYLLNFGSDLSMAPSVMPVVISGDVWGTYKDIRLINESGTWYGLVIDIGSNLYRVNFGTDIGGALTSENLGNLDGWQTLRGIDLKEDGADKVAIISSWGNSKVSLIRFKGTIMNAPEVLTIGEGNSLIDKPFGVSLLQEGSRWFGLLSSYTNNKVLLLDFGVDSLYSDPSVVDLGSTNQPTSSRLVREGSKYYGYTQTERNGTIRYSFGESIADGLNSVSVLGDFGLSLGSVMATSLVNVFPSWQMLLLNTEGLITSLAFPEVSCDSVSLSTSTSVSPDGLVYSSNGDYLVELTAFHANGNINRAYDTIKVAQTAVDASFITSNRCASSMNTFSVTNTSGNIISYRWDFGDGTVLEGEANPSHQYASAGSYISSLTVSNGSCENVYSSMVDIYNPPEASFTSPSANLCSNTPLKFTNTSSYDTGSPVSFSWDFNGDNVEDSAVENPSFTYNSPGTYTISLMVTLADGCMDIFSDEIILDKGPAVSFDLSNNCFGEAIVFNNTTVDDPTYTYQWNFGDGSVISTNRSPTHTYAAGSYSVNLIVSEGSCESVLSQQIEVNDQPLVSISTTRAVENQPVNFIGNDLTLAGDSIVSWMWDFGGLGTTTTQEASYTFSSPGNYTITLSVNTAQGCNTQVSSILNVNVSTLVTSFSVAGDLCKGEEVTLTNHSLNAESYLWDFCQDGLNNLAGTSQVMTLANPNIVVGTEMVYDSGHWHGFVSSLDNGKLLRLAFGADLSSTPQEYDEYGNLGGSPGDIKFYQEAGIWYGLVGLTNTGSLLRLSFNQGLNALPLVENLGDLGGWGSVYGLSIVKDGPNVKLLVSSFTNHFYSLVDFGSSITNTPTAVDILSFGSGNNLISAPIKLELLQDNSVWYGFSTSSGNNKLLRMTFENGLIAAPVINELSTITGAAGLRIVKDGGLYYGFVTRGTGGNLTRLNFNNGLAGSPTVESLGNLGGLLSGTYGFSMVKNQANWLGFYVGLVDKNLSKITFEDQCEGLALKSSQAFEPSGLSYANAGDYLIELAAIDPNGNIDRVLDTVTVLDQTAPDIRFIASDLCVGGTTFSSINESGDITNYRWDFGDGTTLEGEANPSHQYVSAGSYTVSLTVSNGNCENLYSSIVEIYNAPVARFTRPRSSVCTNTPLRFTNTSNYDAGSAVSFSWDFDGDNVEDSDLESPSFTYLSSGTYMVSLAVTLADGCTDIFTDEITLEEGLAVSFDWSNNCFGESIVFNNTTLNVPSYTYRWDFGDGSVFNTNRSPIHSYAVAGTYIVSLAVNDGSCESMFSRQIEINDQSITSFATSTAIEKELVIFTGNDLTLAADSIVSWLWDFGGLGTATTQEASYTFTSPGSYSIALSVNTAQGCSSQASRILNVATASNPTASFSVAGEVCKDESVAFTNSSLNAESYLWDFCHDGLNNLTGTSRALTLTNTNIVVGTEMVYDSGRWHGFVSSRDNSKLLRLAFGSDLSSRPQENDEYGNLGGSPGDIKFYQESGIWYALVGLTNSGSLLKLTFTKGLDALPTTENLGDLGGWGSIYGLSIVKDGSNVKLLVSSFSNRFYSLVDFGSSITNTPTVADVLSFGSGNGLISAPIKLELLKDKGIWYGFSTSSGNNKLLRLTFGSGLTSAPVIDEVATITGAAGLRVVRDGGDYYGFVTRGTGGNLTRLRFANGLAGSPTVQSLGNLGGLLSNTYGFSLVKDQTNWLGFYVGVFDENLSKIAFEDQCEGLVLQRSQAFEPSGLNYANVGDYYVELAAIHPNGNIDRIYDTVTVLDQSAPDIRFTTSDQCVGSTNTFTTINDSGDITNYRWDFGDGTILEGEANPSHQYASAGSYTARLTVSNGGCENIYSSIVNIYNASVASFDKPTSSVCTNTPLQFSNTSSYDAGSPVSFSWDFDGDNVEDSALESPSFIYTVPGTYQVSLEVTLVDGCTDIFKDEIILDDGPEVSFDWSNNCFGEEVIFNNTTLDVSSYFYTWDFGDGSVFNNNRSPAHAYAEAGSYTVTLTVSEGNCESVFFRQIEITDQPLASITTSIAVENEPIIFTGNDLTLAGDSVVSWVWDFDGLGTATTQEASYTFTNPGSYTITLNVTTAQGCIAQLSSTLNVEAASSPTASFSIAGDVCMGENVALTNSSLNAESYLWDFCFESLSGQPEITGDFTPVAGISNSEGFEMVYDKGNWFGFIGDRSNGQMYLLNFGSDPSKEPSVTPVVISGDVWGTYKDIRLINESGTWYGLVIDIGSNLYRVNFGTDIGGALTSENLGNLGGWQTLRGIDLKEDGADKVAIISSWGNNKVSLIRFKGTVTNVPEVLTIGGGNSLIDKPFGVSLLQEGSRWFGLLSSYTNNKVLLLDFGVDSLYSEPSITEISESNNPTSSRFEKEGEKYFGYVNQENGVIIRYDFGYSVSDGIDSISVLGNLGGN